MVTWSLTLCSSRAATFFASNGKCGKTWFPGLFLAIDAFFELQSLSPCLSQQLQSSAASWAQVYPTNWMWSRTKLWGLLIDSFVHLATFINMEKEEKDKSSGKCYNLLSCHGGLHQPTHPQPLDRNNPRPSHATSYMRIQVLFWNWHVLPSLARWTSLQHIRIWWWTMRGGAPSHVLNLIVSWCTKYTLRQGLREFSYT